MAWKHTQTIKCKEAVYSATWSDDGKVLYSGGTDGHVVGFDAKGKKVLDMDTNLNGEVIPITRVKLVSKSKMVAARSDGSVVRVDLAERVAEPWVKEDNEIYTVAVAKDRTRFYTSGRDGLVRMYDMSRDTPLATMGQDGAFDVGVHPVRVYALRCAPKSDHVVWTGGWGSVKAWDTRAGGEPVKEVLGPYMVGEALGFSAGDTLITGSHRPDDQIEHWDLTTCNRLSVLSEPSLGFLPTFLATSGSPYKYIATGGGGSLPANHAGVILSHNASTTLASVPTTQPRAFHCCEFNQKSTAAAFGDAGGCLHVMELK